MRINQVALIITSHVPFTQLVQDDLVVIISIHGKLAKAKWHEDDKINPVYVTEADIEVIGEL